MAKFLESYDAPKKDAIWQQQSATFRRFWSEQVLAQGTSAISDDACDVVIRILDRNGKGNTRGCEAVAAAMVPQGVWRKLFNDLHRDQKLALLIDASFKETELDRKIALIDKVCAANEGKKNGLTGENGNVINALLAGYDPVNNLTIISLNTRRTQMDFLKLELAFDWDKASFGQRVIQSNVLLREGTRALGLAGTARTLSCFWYFNPVKELWKPEDTVKRTNREEVSVTVPKNVGAEKDGSANEDELRESLRTRPFWLRSACRWGFGFGCLVPIGQEFLQSGSLMEGNCWINCRGALTKPR